MPSAQRHLVARSISLSAPTHVLSGPPRPSSLDLADLAPEDRERVLRLLFAKINSVQAALEPAPQHTLDEGQLEAIGADVAGAASTLARDNGAGMGTMSTQMIDGSGMFASQ